MKNMIFTPLIVETIPDHLEDRILYVSMKYNTAIHKCACGCGEQTVTPFSSGGWKLRLENESITIEPSIGNFQYPCKSHYWIRENKVIWA